MGAKADVCPPSQIMGGSCPPPLVPTPLPIYSTNTSSKAVSEIATDIDASSNYSIRLLKTLMLLPYKGLNYHGADAAFEMR